MSSLKKYITYTEQAEKVDNDKIWDEYDNTLKNLTYDEIGCMFEDLESALKQMLLNPKDTKLDNIEFLTISNRIKDISSLYEAFNKIALLKRVYER